MKLPNRPVKGDWVEFMRGGTIYNGYVKHVFTSHIVIDSEREPAQLMARNEDYRNLVYKKAA